MGRRFKQASIDSYNVWKAAGKPRTRPIFDKRQECRLQYLSRIREGEKLETTSYTNELHEAVLDKLAQCSVLESLEIYI